MMLAVFEKTVANSPEALQRPHSSESAAYALKDEFLMTHFASVHRGSVTLNFGSSGFLAKSCSYPDSPVSRLDHDVVDNICCLFQGHIENLTFLKKQYGLNKDTYEPKIVIEAYKTFRDRGPYPVDKVVRDFHGKFAFILFDVAKKTVFAAADADGSVPFFWGTDAEGHLVLSDNIEIVKKGCGKSYGTFPKGCFFTSSNGLRSFAQPKKERRS